MPIFPFVFIQIIFVWRLRKTKKGTSFVIPSKATQFVSENCSNEMEYWKSCAHCSLVTVLTVTPVPVSIECLYAYQFRNSSSWWNVFNSYYNIWKFKCHSKLHLQAVWFVSSEFCYSKVLPFRWKIFSKSLNCLQWTAYLRVCIQFHKNNWTDQLLSIIFIFLWLWNGKRLSYFNFKSRSMFESNEKRPHTHTEWSMEIYEKYFKFHIKINCSLAE